jgi:hypothetical protein
MYKKINIAKTIMAFSICSLYQASHANTVTFNVAALNVGTINSASLQCQTPASRFAQCPATANPTIAGIVSGQAINFNLSDIQHRAFPSDARCPVDQLQCHLTINNQAINQVAFSSIAHVPCNGSVCWAMTNMKVTPNDADTATDFIAKSEQISYSQYQNYYQNWTDSAYAVDAGFIDYTGQVAAPPAILQCGNKSITAVAHDGKHGFPLRALFSGTDPAQDETVTDCKLKDSSPNSPTYAVFNEIDEISAEKAETSHTLTWVADVEKFNYGNADYLVTRPEGRDPSQLHPDAFNQWDMAIKTLQPGTITFAGFSNVQPQNLQVSCDQHAPITLDKHYQVNLGTLHNTSQTINTPDNFQNCELTSANKQTVYLQFMVSNLAGNIATNNNQAYWTAEVNGIKPVASQIKTDPTVSNTQCNTELPNQCADWTITVS